MMRSLYLLGVLLFLSITSASAQVGAGELRAFGQTRTGLGIQLETIDRVATTDLSDAAVAEGEDPAVLTIDLNAGFGDVTIERNDR